MPVHAYRGWRSTKLHLALIVMALITLVYWRVGFSAGEFGEFCWALLGAAGIYSGSAVAERFSRPRDPAPAPDPYAAPPPPVL